MVFTEADCGVFNRESSNASSMSKSSSSLSIGSLSTDDSKSGNAEANQLCLIASRFIRRCSSSTNSFVTFVISIESLLSDF